MTTITLVVIRCQNRLCDPRADKRPIIGEAAPGSVVKIQCRKCRQFTFLSVAG